MIEKQSADRTFTCNNPETITLRFSPAVSRGDISYKFEGSSQTWVEDNKIEFTMSGSPKVLRVEFFMNADSADRHTNITGSSGGSYDDDPPINSRTGDGKILTFHFE